MMLNRFLLVFVYFLVMLSGSHAVIMSENCIDAMMNPAITPEQFDLTCPPTQISTTVTGFLYAAVRIYKRNFFVSDCLVYAIRRAEYLNLATSTNIKGFAVDTYIDISRNNPVHMTSSEFWDIIYSLGYSPV